MQIMIINGNKIINGNYDSSVKEYPCKNEWRRSDLIQNLISQSCFLIRGRFVQFIYPQRELKDFPEK